MKHFSEGNVEDNYEQSLSHHLSEGYDPMKEYESHIGCNYDEDDCHNWDDDGGIRHFSDDDSYYSMEMYE